jgi:2-polyprenylphenol 6-hydroxylase
MSTTDFDIVIVGGGLAGAGLAVALAGTPWRVALVEGREPPPPPPGWDVRVYAISPSSRRFLEGIGAWPALDAARIAPIHDMRIAGDGINAGFGPDFGALRFSAYETGVEALAWIAESGRLMDVLWQAMRRQPKLTLLCPESPGADDSLELSDDEATLRLADGRRITTRLVVAADGRDSRLRTLAGLVATEKPYGELGVVANFRTEHDHRGCAFQWFRDDGVLAWLPLPDRHVSMVWSCTEPTSRILLELPTTELADAVAGAGADRLGAFETVTPAAGFPLRLIEVPKTIARRFALLGDAAHGIHPLSGHGINLGFSDARDLAGLLGSAQDPGDASLLARYQAMRRQETVLLQQGTHALHELFRSRLPGISLLRNLGLSLTDRAGPVKSLLARYAMG